MGSDGCSVYRGFVSQLRNPELREPTACIASSNLLFLWEDVLPHLSRLPASQTTLRNGPVKGTVRALQPWQGKPCLASWLLLNYVGFSWRISLYGEVPSLFIKLWEWPRKMLDLMIRNQCYLLSLSSRNLT